MIIDGLNSEIYRLLDKKFELLDAPFSNFFVFVIQKIEEFVAHISVYLRGIYDFDGKIFVETQDFLTKINTIISNHCRQGSFDLISLSSISNDVVKLQSMNNYFVNFVKKQMDNNFSFEINTQQIFENTKTELDNRIHTDYPVSLSFHLSHWLGTKWLNTKQFTEPRLFVQELGHFLKTTLTEISKINYSVGVSLAYMSFREINKTLADIFLHQVKNFNIVDIANIDMELNYLTKIADEEFFHLDQLKEE